MIRLPFAALCALAFSSGGPAAAQDQVPDVKNLAASFLTRPGFRIELVANEPDVQAPVALAFDEVGRLFVAERDAENPQSGRIRLLEDPDNTGAFNRRTVYAENIPYPSALACYDGGVFVASGSQVVYLKDTRQDRRADIQRVVFSGFSPLATNSAGSQPVIHTLAWGPDSRIHGGTLLEGGFVYPDTDAPPVALGNHDFSFDPRTLSISIEPGPSRSGMAFDFRGRKFGSDPMRPLRLALFHPRYWEGNPFFPPPPGMVDVSMPGHPVFRAFAGETNANWVTPRSSRALADRASTNRLEPAFLRAARGTVIHSSPVFPAGYQGNVFLADPENHVIHRLVLRENGLVPVAARAREEAATEFLVCRSPEFRPVSLAQGMDGGLYIADYADGRQGRIFRVLPTSFVRPNPAFSAKTTTLELLSALTSTNAWHHQTAARLLYTRADPASVALLSNMVLQAGSPFARRTALRMLGVMGSVTEAPLLRGLSDPDPAVREAAVLLAEQPSFLKNPSRAALLRLSQMAGDSDPSVRYQVALTYGRMRQGGQNSLLEAMVRRDLGSRYLESATLSALEPSAAPVFARLARDAAFRNSPAGQSFLLRLTAMLGVRGDLQEALQTLDVLTTVSAPPQQVMRWMHEFGAGLQRTRSSLALIDVQATNRAAYPAFTVAALDQNLSVPDRVAAIKAAGVSPLTFTDVGDWLILMLNPRENVAIQNATLETLQRFPDPAIGPALVQRWSLMSPAVRTHAGRVLTHRPEWTASLLGAIQSGRMNPAELSPQTINFLRTHFDPSVSQIAVQRLGTAPVERPQVVQAYQPALDAQGSAARGREIFAARCAACHNLAGQDSTGGTPVAFAAAGKQKLLRDIIEPHREIARGWRTSVVETRSGETFLGVVEREAPPALSLRQVDGEVVVLPRSNIGIVRPQVWSLMPEGLEMGLSLQAMADLLEYITRLGVATPAR